jgi:hypothetical protein
MAADDRLGRRVAKRLTKASFLDEATSRKIARRRTKQKLSEIGKRVFMT